MGFNPIYVEVVLGIFRGRDVHHSGTLANFPYLGRDVRTHSKSNTERGFEGNEAVVCVPRSIRRKSCANNQQESHSCIDRVTGASGISNRRKEQDEKGKKVARRRQCGADEIHPGSLGLSNKRRAREH
jgi:hypothetical protein